MADTLRVAAVQLWSEPERAPEANRAHALKMLEEAARPRPDLVVMPEAVTMLCYPDGHPNFSYRDVAEPLPGPTSEAACRIAARYGVNVVLGLIEDRGPDRPCQNLALVIDRKGRIAGRYEKTHEPEVCRTDQAAGRGEELPVFELDFGTIGVFICWDLIAPEAPAILVAKGARLLCFPHLIGLPSQLNFAVTLRARAVDNAVPIVAAGMRDAHNHNGSQEGVYPTCIIDARGEIIAQSDRPGANVVSAELTLAPLRLDYIGRLEPGIDWQAQRRAEVRPDLYAREYARHLNQRPTP